MPAGARRLAHRGSGRGRTMARLDQDEFLQLVKAPLRPNANADPLKIGSASRRARSQKKQFLAGDYVAINGVPFIYSLGLSAASGTYEKSRLLSNRPIRGEFRSVQLRTSRGSGSL